jgi:hypothetical protein
MLYRTMETWLDKVLLLLSFRIWIEVSRGFACSPEEERRTIVSSVNRCAVLGSLPCVPCQLLHPFRPHTATLARTVAPVVHESLDI